MIYLNHTLFNNNWHTGHTHIPTYFPAWPGSTSASPSADCQHSPCLAMARHSLLSTPPSWTPVSTPRPWPPTPGWLLRLLPAASTPSWLPMVVRYQSYPGSCESSLKIIFQGQLFTGSLEPSTASLGGWLQLVTASPRHTSLLAGKNSGAKSRENLA